jgi:hypothetical protein
MICSEIAMVLLVVSNSSWKFVFYLLKKRKIVFLLDTIRIHNMFIIFFKLPEHVRILY